MKRVLVTGSAGQVGSWVLERRPVGVEVVPLDLRNAESVDIRSPKAARMAGEAEVILHLAALIDVQASLKDPAETMSVNVEGTRNLLQAARPGTRFVFVSSAAVYADGGGRPLAEDAPLAPISPYGESKMKGESLVREVGARRGLDWVILRPFNIYSSRQAPNSPYTGVITAFAKAAMEGKAFTIHGDGLQTRDFVHACDVADLLWRVGTVPQVSEANGRTYNVATGRSITILELAKQVQAACDVQVPIHHGPARAGDIRHSEADVRRAFGLGWHPRMGLVEGLAETVAGLRTSGKARGPGGATPRRQG